MSDRRFLEKLRDGARALISTRGVAMVNERPIVSFTFDGFAKSAALNAATTLERRGAAGTFYASRHFCGATVDGVDYYDLDDLRRLVDNGHEIGSRTAGQVRAPSIGSEQLAADLEFERRVHSRAARRFADDHVRLSLRRYRHANQTADGAALRGLPVDLAGRQRGRRRSRSAARRAPRFAIDGRSGGEGSDRAFRAAAVLAHLLYAGRGRVRPVLTAARLRCSSMRSTVLCRWAARCSPFATRLARSAFAPQPSETARPPDVAGGVHFCRLRRSMRWSGLPVSPRNPAASPWIAATKFLVDPTARYWLVRRKDTNTVQANQPGWCRRTK